uniref:Uncharacterized protein n=1 Tax=Panagrolaimus davidi TaxID=227884 RepID=A0A914QP94_9BILA
MYLLAKLVDYYDNLPTYKKTSDKTGVRSGEVEMSYRSITQDVVGAVNWVHINSEMKDYILQNIEKYIHKADKLRNMMIQLRSAGAKTFLLTNSEYKYTHGVMTYLAGPDWPQLFDIAIVDAKKPQWFMESSLFRQVDTTTGTLKVGMHAGQLKRGNVYAGGSCDALKRLMKFRGKDVLYVGDHIFGDVLRSKKSRGWRTFLVVPELTHELKKVTNEMDQAYGLLGSLFRSGSRTTFFATQVQRYADLYSSTCYNLIHYPKFYFFRAPMMLLPHESTVDHLAKIIAQTNVVGSRRPSLCLENIEDNACHEEKNPPSKNKIEYSEVEENGYKDQFFE